MDASDSSLIREFLKGGQEAPFRQLVERYQDMVFSAAMRRTGDAGRAEEVAQDVFLLFAARARTLVACPNLAGWFYKTTLKKSANRMRSDISREQREGRYAAEAEATEGAASAVPPMAFALVDEALASLRPKDRDALVLRYFRGLGLAEVGRAQGASAEAARKRVRRALSKMEGFLRGRGVAVPSAVAAAAVLQQSTQAAPAGFASATAGLAPVPAATFVTSTFTSIITMTKTQIAVAAALVVAAPIVVHQTAISKLEDEKEELAGRATTGPSPSSVTGSPGEEGGTLTALTPGGSVGDASGQGREVAGSGNEDYEAYLDELVSLWGDEANFDAMISLVAQQERVEANKLLEMVAKLALDEATAAKVREQISQNLARSEGQRKKMRDVAAKIREQASRSPDPEGTLRATVDRFKSSRMTPDELAALGITGEEMEPGDVEPGMGIEALLSDEQNRRLEAMQDEKKWERRRKKAEQRVYRELAEIQGLLQLTDEQKDRAVAALRGNYFSLAEPGVIKIDPGADLSGLSVSGIMRKRMEMKLAKFSEFLEPDQLGVYRKHLEKDLERYVEDAGEAE